MKHPIDKLKEQLRQAGAIKINVEHFRSFHDPVMGQRTRPLRELKKGDHPGAQILPNGGCVRVRVAMKDGRGIDARAECSRKDNFCGRTGTAIAMGRALKAIQHPDAQIKHTVAGTVLIEAKDEIKTEKT